MGPQDRLKIDEAIDLRDLLLKCLTDTSFLDSGELKNFEYLIHLSDKAAFYLSSLYKGMPHDPAQIDACLLRLDNSLKPLFLDTQTGGWKYLLWLPREIVINLILDAWEALESTSRKSILHLHQEFFGELAERYGQIHIYNLNYDPIVHEAVVTSMSFETGFSESTFYPGEFHRASRTLAALHGYVGFLPRNRRLELRSDYRFAQRARIKSLVNGYPGAEGMKGRHANTYLVTGLDKLDPLSTDPFATYYQRLARDLYDSNVIVLIGYGFGDDHINALLRNCENFLNQERIVIVDLKEPDCIRCLAKTGLLIPEPADSLLRALTVIGHTHQVRNLQDLAGDVEKRGFGQLTGKTIFYGWGTEKFLASDFAAIAGCP